MTNETMPPEGALRRQLVLLVSISDGRFAIAPSTVLLKSFAVARSFDNEFDIRLLHFHLGQSTEEILTELRGHKGVALYGLSVYLWNARTMLDIVKALSNDNPQSRIAAGGPEGSGLAEHFLNSGAHFVVHGEGEIPFCHLLDHIAGRIPASDLKGVSHLLNGEMLPATDQGPLPAEDTPPMLIPDFTDSLDRSPKPLTVSYQTSRGCPMRCSYCHWSACSTLRHSPQALIEKEIRYLLLHPKVEIIAFNDSNIFFDRERALRIFHFIGRENIHNKPLMFEVNIDTLTDELIDLLAGLPNNDFNFGLQSTSRRVLKAVRRPFNRRRFVRNFRRFKRKAPLTRLWISLMAGLPQDSLKTLIASVEFALKLSPNAIELNELLILPDTALFRDRERFGLKSNDLPPHQLLAHSAMTMAQIKEISQHVFYLGYLHMVDFVRVPLFYVWRRYIRKNIYAYYLAFLRSFMKVSPKIKMDGEFHSMNAAQGLDALLSDDELASQLYVFTRSFISGHDRVPGDHKPKILAMLELVHELYVAHVFCDAGYRKELCLGYRILYDGYRVSGIRSKMTKYTLEVRRSEGGAEELHVDIR